MINTFNLGVDFSCAARTKAGARKSGLPAVAASMLPALKILLRENNFIMPFVLTELTKAG